jgi:hypothetical protein
MKQYGLVLLLTAVVAASMASAIGKVTLDLFERANSAIQEAVGGLR